MFKALVTQPSPLHLLSDVTPKAHLDQCQFWVFVILETNKPRKTIVVWKEHDKGSVKRECPINGRDFCDMFSKSLKEAKTRVTSMPEEEQPVVCICVCVWECFGLTEVYVCDGVGTVPRMACHSHSHVCQKNCPCPQQVNPAGCGVPWTPRPKCLI